VESLEAGTPIVHQILVDGLGPALAEALIVAGAAVAVGVTTIRTLTPSLARRVSAITSRIGKLSALMLALPESK
jgi:hypothetical protein